jgi:hypothetical protein
MSSATFSPPEIPDDERAPTLKEQQFNPTTSEEQELHELAENNPSAFVLIRHGRFGDAASSSSEPRVSLPILQFSGGSEKLSQMAILPSLRVDEDDDDHKTQPEAEQSCSKRNRNWTLAEMLLLLKAVDIHNPFAFHDKDSKSTGSWLLVQQEMSRLKAAEVARYEKLHQPVPADVSSIPKRDLQSTIDKLGEIKSNVAFYKRKKEEAARNGGALANELDRNHKPVIPQVWMDRYCPSLESLVDSVNARAFNSGPSVVIESSTHSPSQAQSALMTQLASRQKDMQLQKEAELHKNKQRADKRDRALEELQDVVKEEFRNRKASRDSRDEAWKRQDQLSERSVAAMEQTAASFSDWVNLKKKQRKEE